MSSSSQARFIKTAMAEKDYPILKDVSGNILPEIAVVGRSNVGKSSLLNHLFHSKHLVKTSSEPGKTQAINFFSFEDLIFVDLPGYGYAKVSQSIRKDWGPMMKTYFRQRESLKLVLLLLDVRRTPNKEDLQFIEWASHHDKALIVVLTKVDKLNRKEKSCEYPSCQLFRSEKYRTKAIIVYDQGCPSGRGIRDFVRRRI